MIKNDENMKNRIFNLLDRIEDKTGKMAHEIVGLNEKLNHWQKGLVRDLFFLNYLSKFLDDLN